MNFAYPLGLLGLLGIPVLIAIYIIKNKYTEQTVASTYIWTVSEKFLKNKKKIPKIAGIISLIVEILIVATISILISGPKLVFPNAAKEYCFILDASGSMGAVSDGKSRFDIGKEKISEIIDNSAKGSLYTLVYLGDTETSVVFEHEENKEDAISALMDTEVSFSAADNADAIKIAQGYFSKNRAMAAYFITDSDYPKHDNVEIVNVSRGEKNYSVNSPTYVFEDGALTASATIFSTENSGEITVEFFLNGEPAPTETKVVSLDGDKGAAVSFTKELSTFQSFRISIKANDSMPTDDSAVIYNLHSSESYSTLIVSNTPFFLRTAIEVITYSKVTVMSEKEYNERMDKAASGGAPISGYGLYVFDGVVPRALPKDGSVWLLNVASTVDGAGISFQGDVDSKEIIFPSLSDGSSTLSEKLTRGLNGRDFAVDKFIKYGVSGFTPIYEYNKQPLLFANENEYGNRQVVFAFSLHDSNLPLLEDFIPLIQNLLSYSFPELVDKVNYECGEKLQVNVPANANEIKIVSPTGKVEYPTSGAAASEFVLNEPGTYKISVTFGDGADSLVREHLLSATLTSGESLGETTYTSFALQGKAGEGGLDAIYDDVIVLVILLAVIFSADWMVYCYDKYQLR